MTSILDQGSVVAERYRLVRPLGKGGMGSVWLAHHLSLDIPCAVKFMNAEAASSTDIRSRFEREARAAAQIRSPNVVQTLDHGTWQGVPYIAMELLEGEDLRARLRRLLRLSPAETLSIATQIARALTRAHAVGLVHRDLKPGNIFLVRDDDREIAKVLDFGVAKTSGSPTLEDSTKTGTLLGTPFYMSPEQAQGTRQVDHRSDLWALAVVVYQCLTGKLPFHSAALGDLFMKIMVLPIPVPSQAGPVPPGFDAWWIRAVARDPVDRFQTAKEFSEALELALVGRAPELSLATYTGSFLEIPSASPSAFPPAPVGATLSASATATASASVPVTASASVPASASASVPPPVPLLASITPPPPTYGGISSTHSRGARRPQLAIFLAMGIVITLGIGGVTAFVLLRARPAGAVPSASSAPQAAPGPTATAEPQVALALEPPAPPASASAAAPPAKPSADPGKSSPKVPPKKRHDFGI